MNSMRIALAQYALGSDVNANLDKAFAHMERAAAQGADLILFPELCTTLFFPRSAGQAVAHLAVSIDDDLIGAFRDTCRRMNIAAAPNVYFRESAGLFDASLLIGADGRIHGVSKMVHIAQLPGFYEQDYYTPSDTGFHTYNTSLGPIGIVVCFDRHYPESIRTCVVRGASIVLIPTANTLDEPRDLFECELRAAAFQNGVFVAMCNRVGVEGEAGFCGESTVIGPAGEVMAKAGTTEQLLLVDVDLAMVSEARSKRPYLSLRRPRMYD
jgi:predicted amidohydrolase